MRKILAMLIPLVVLCLGQAHAGIKMRTVQAEGMGSSLNLAIYDALDEAIGRVNGKSIDTRRQLEAVEISQVDSDKEEYYASEIYISQIKSATKGVVDNYEILSKHLGGGGLYHVTLSVTVSIFETEQNNSKRIAIFPFRVGTGSFQLGKDSVDKERLTSLVAQNLVTTLVQSRRFTVLDREYLAETVDEQDLILSPSAPIEEMTRLGQELVADYIMVGTIESFGYNEQNAIIQSSGREFTYFLGYVELSIRLADVATRQIVFADFHKLYVTEDDIERFGGSFRSVGVDASIATVVADRIGRKILDAIYPLVVVSVNGEILTLGQGGSQVKEGDHLELFMYGERLVDPYTKEFLGREEIKVGMIEITRVNPKQSHARILQISMDINQEFEPQKFICRGMLDTLDNEEEQLEEQRKQREERRKERDDDW